MRIEKLNMAKIIAVYAAIAILTVWFGVFYFSVKEFELDFHTYRAAEDTGQYVRYVSKTGTPVVVRMNGPDRTVTIDGQDYRIRAEEQPSGTEFRVQYPDGKTYIVSEQHHMMALDENGNFVMAKVIAFGPNGERMLFGDENLRFHPAGLVRAAYAQYHESRGYPWLYVLSILMFAFGWANFRYESVQRAMFWASLKWIWVENPEPSEFYFFMSKISGVVIMILSFVMFLQSLFRDYVIMGVL